MPSRLCLALVAAVAATAARAASPAPDAPAPDGPPLGRWILPGAACPMHFEIAAPDRVVRTTGSLTYTTRVVFRPASHGWEMQETLLGDNGGKSCKGQPIDTVRKHLANRTHVRMLGDALFYSGEGNLQFRRVPSPE